MIKNNIRKLRERNGLTQAGLIECIRVRGRDVSAGMMSQIESGMSMPDYELLHHLAAALEAPITGIYPPKIIEAIYGIEDGGKKPARTATGDKKRQIKLYERDGVIKIVDEEVCRRGFNSRSELLSHVLHSYLENAGLI